MYGDTAESVLDIASDRLLKWSQAFDDWLNERYPSKGGKRQAAQAWCRFLKNRSRAPWSFSKRDVEEHVKWMRAEGYVGRTIIPR